MASSVALGRPRRVDWHPQHFHTVCLGGTHPYHVLGPLTRPLRHSQGPQKGPFWPFWGPRRSLGSPGGPDLGPSATGWSNWVGRIHIMCSGPFRDHYGTPGAPKRARFGPDRPFWGPRRSLGSPGGPNLGGSFCGLLLPLLVAAIIRVPANYRVVHLVIFAIHYYLLLCPRHVTVCFYSLQFLALCYSSLLLHPSPAAPL